jgi:hypothetical protein
LIGETEDDQGLKAFLASIEESRAVCLRELGRMEEAKAALEYRLGFVKESLEHRPDNLNTQVSLIYATFNLAVWHMQTKTPQGYEEALRLFEEVKERIRELVDSGRSVTRQRDLDRLAAGAAQNIKIIKKRQAKLATTPDATALPAP